MNKLFTYALALAVSMGTTALLANSARTVHPNQRPEAELAADGAFRDGLYVGRLALENGWSVHPPIGRWSNQEDRASFMAGYERGYGAVPDQR